MRPITRKCLCASILFVQYADRWVAGHAPQIADKFRFSNSRFDTLEAAAVSDGSGHRVSETTPRAAATTREAQTLTAAHTES